ncbi:MAG: hypothetical protein JWO82_2348, partial [Akkermansiaceae bacterium]|nr:hypothetical protein [Akkermansiaceae bacterium]
MTIRKRPWLKTLRCAFAGLSMACGTAVNAATLPIGFAETKIADGLNPTTMSFAPDGRLFLCEKQGVLRVVVDGAMLAAPVLDLSKSVDSWNERGFLSVCFDPEFTRNGWIYVYYTHPREPGDASHGSSNNRVSRFTLKGNVAVPNSELVLLEIDHLSKIGWHNGGGLNFGKDGKLYISTGENANGPNAQDGGNLLGKLLRFNKDGSIPSDNPHYRDFAGNSRAIVAMGLRNPFTIAAQRTTGLLYLSVVGDRYEQIEGYNSGAAPVAVNYGWPGIDGPPRNQTPPAGYQAPVHAYDHGSGDATALCGGDFYNPVKPGADAFPAEYTGRFFFSDYRGWIKTIDPAKPGTRSDFASGIDRPIDVDTAPDGALWYIARAGTPGGSDAANTSSSNGSLWRVRWTGGGQPVKLAVIQQPGGANAGEPVGEVKEALQDAHGETVSAATDTVTLTLDGNAAGTLAGTTQVAAVKGVASFPALTVGKPGHGYVLRASSGGMTAAMSAAFDIGNQVATPAISPAGGTFSGPVWVQISCSTPGMTILFTTDGTDPKGNSETYRGPFQMTARGTIKALAQRSGLADSVMAEAKIGGVGNTPYGMDYRPAVNGLRLAADPEGLPVTLSGTGIFIDRNLTPRPGIVPYSLNSP